MTNTLTQKLKSVGKKALATALVAGGLFGCGPNYKPCDFFFGTIDGETINFEYEKDLVKFDCADKRICDYVEANFKLTANKKNGCTISYFGNTFLGIPYFGSLNEIVMDCNTSREIFSSRHANDKQVIEEGEKELLRYFNFMEEMLERGKLENKKSLLIYSNKKTNDALNRIKGK
ncbi:MAG: hypothetical protein WC755_09655 [Candidatus Woesearchaeota archaeon]|jgi:hypothetical protein